MSNPKEPPKPKLTELGQPLDLAVSALQKEIRRGDERAAVYWTLLVFRQSPGYAWRRVLVTAAEDAGFGDPAAVALVGQLHSMWLASFSAKSSHHLVMAVMALCRAKRSCEVEDLQSVVLEEIKEGVKYPILDEYANGHTAAGRQRGVGWKSWYRFRHGVCGYPVSAYTKELWRMRRDYAPDELVDDPSPSEPGESPA